MSIQCQRVFGSLDQRLKGADQLGRAGEEAIHDDFFIPGGQHPSQLASAPVALAGEAAWAGEGGFLAAGQASDIHIQQFQYWI